MLDTAALVRSVQLDLQEHPDYPAWTDEHFSEMLRAAMDQLALVRPEAFQRVASVALQRGVTHHIPEDGVRLIEVTANVDQGLPGEAVTRVDGATMARFDPAWRSRPEADQVDHYLWDERQPRVFHTVPAVRSGTRVQIVYIQQPPAFEVGEYPTLEQMPSHYREPLRHWMLYRAWLKGTRPGIEPKAQAHYEWFYHALGEKVPTSQRVDPRTQEPHQRA
ncbi:DUF6682 family protein [Halorhodospira sp. 9622]|uniref:phage adaptor protein n=1 Tax=Halorhodospira sp. 9622 TaxID=2899136 RepID=UPI001EE982DF|nr:DUF6682 family protein [Halorhodospira sp. 9622]MCG5537861.1 hypothetical protein [Halorhodospira sp. 9622]